MGRGQGPGCQIRPGSHHKGLCLLGREVATPSLQPLAQGKSCFPPAQGRSLCSSSAFHICICASQKQDPGQSVSKWNLWQAVPQPCSSWSSCIHEAVASPCYSVLHCPVLTTRNFFMLQPWGSSLCIKTSAPRLRLGSGVTRPEFVLPHPLLSWGNHGVKGKSSFQLL